MGTIILNDLYATVKEIKSFEGLNIVSFDFNKTTLSMMSLELDSKIQVGTTVILGVKPSNITIAKNLSGQLSSSNQIKSIVCNVTKGKLLSTINMKAEDTLMESLITLSSQQRLNLQVGDEITALIKATELYIEEVFYD